MPTPEARADRRCRRVRGSRACASVTAAARISGLFGDLLPVGVGHQRSRPCGRIAPSSATGWCPGTRWLGAGFRWLHRCSASCVRRAPGRCTVTGTPSCTTGCRNPTSWYNFWCMSRRWSRLGNRHILRNRCDNGTDGEASHDTAKAVHHGHILLGLITPCGHELCYVRLRC